MCGNLGAAAFPVVVPWLLTNAGGWDAVLIGFTALYASAALFWLLLVRRVLALRQGRMLLATKVSFHEVLVARIAPIAL